MIAFQSYFYNIINIYNEKKKQKNQMKIRYLNIKK